MRSTVVRATVMICLAMLAAPFDAVGQGGPSTLPLTPTMSDLNSIERQRQAFRESGVGVARIYIRFDGDEVTTLFEKENPQFVNWFAASNDSKWARRARTLKPVTTAAEPGRLVIRSRWNSSAFDRNATCDFDDFTPGFYEVFLLNSSGTSEAFDMSRDNYVCSIQLLPLTQEILDQWVGGIPAEKHSLVRECADTSGNVAGPQFWECVSEQGIRMPPLDKATLEMLDGS